MIINKSGVAVIGSYPGTAQICQRLFAVLITFQFEWVYLWDSKYFFFHRPDIITNQNVILQKSITNKRKTTWTKRHVTLWEGAHKGDLSCCQVL